MASPFRRVGAALGALLAGSFSLFAQTPAYNPKPPIPGLKNLNLGGAANIKTGKYGTNIYMVPYPRTSAGSTNAVAVVPAANRNFEGVNQLKTPPYRTHSWLGGALWGTGQVESDYWSPNYIVDATTPPEITPDMRAWVQIPLKQYPIWTAGYNIWYQPQLASQNLSTTSIPAGNVTITNGSILATLSSGGITTASLQNGMTVTYTGTDKKLYSNTIEAILNATQFVLASPAGQTSQGTVTFTGATSPNAVGINIGGNYPFFVADSTYASTLPSAGDWTNRSPLKCSVTSSLPDILIQPFKSIPAAIMAQQSASSSFPTNFTIFDPSSKNWVNNNVSAGSSVSLTFPSALSSLNGVYSVQAPGQFAAQTIIKSTASNPTTITTQGAHGFTTNTWVNIAGCVTPQNQNLPVQGFYQVAKVPTTNTFVIAATGGGTGGTAAEVDTASNGTFGYFVTIPQSTAGQATNTVSIAATPPPPTEGTAVTPQWMQLSNSTADPKNPGLLLMDRMGDFDVDVVYQDPKDPYAYTPFSSTAGKGTYIKLTVMQNSPYIWAEVRGVPHVMLRQTMSMIPGDSSGAIWPGGSAVPYYQMIAYDSATDPSIISQLDLPAGMDAAILAGDVNGPNGASASIAFNPAGSQDNWATYGIFFKTGTATFYNDLNSASTSYSFGTLNHRLDIANPNVKTYFVIARTPTRYNYPGQNLFGDQAITWYEDNVQANAIEWLKELAKHAFSFPNDTVISYSVSQGHKLTTEFYGSFYNPYTTTSPSFTDGKTVFLVPPHQWQPNTLAGSLAPDPLDLATPGAIDLSATLPESSSFQYWSTFGRHKAVLGTGYNVNYIFNNFLPAPPLDPNLLTEEISSDVASTPFTSYPLGEFMFLDMYRNLQTATGSSSFPLNGGQYNKPVTNGTINTNVGFGPWNPVSYKNQPAGVYNLGYTISSMAKQIPMMQQYLQLFGGTFDGVAPTSANYGTASTQLTNAWTDLSFSTIGTTAYPWIGTIQDPNSFWAANNPITNLQNAVQLSVAGVSAALAGVFQAKSTISAGFVAEGAAPNLNFSDTNFANFGYYDQDSYSFIIHPISTGLSAEAFPAPGSLGDWSSIDSTIAAGEYAMVNEGFGLAANNNDHHYNYGPWISSAALVAAFDGSWNPTNSKNFKPALGTMAYDPVKKKIPKNSLVGAIDAMVMDLAYDPSVTEWSVSSKNFRSDKQAPFAKLQFIDQMYGVAWTDGLQAANSGGNGHNHNSVGEANNAFAAVALWGIATGRKQIADLGIYLYTTSSYSNDFYFYDKNNNFKPAAPLTSASATGFFVPITTAETTVAGSGVTYAANTCVLDYGICYTQNDNHNPPTSIDTLLAGGTPINFQGAAGFATTFDFNPQSTFYIQAQPQTAYTMLMSRNPVYMANWANAINQSQYAFDQLPGSSTAGDWDAAFAPNMLMVNALVGMPTPTTYLVNGQNTNLSSNPYPGTATDSSLQWFFNMTTDNTDSANPPWNNTWLDAGPTGAVIESPGDKTISEVLAFLYSLEEYGQPDFSVVGVPDPSTKVAGTSPYVYTACFNNAGARTYVAYNPGTNSTTVNFYLLNADGSIPGSALKTATVPAKQWYIQQ